MLVCGSEVTCICTWTEPFFGLQGVLFEGVGSFVYVYKL